MVRSRTVDAPDYQTVDTRLGIRIVVAGVAEGTCGKVFAVKTVTKVTEFAKGSIEKIIKGGVALETYKKCTIIC